MTWLQSTEYRPIDIRIYHIHIHWKMTHSTIRIQNQNNIDIRSFKIYWLILYSLNLHIGNIYSLSVVIGYVVFLINWLGHKHVFQLNATSIASHTLSVVLQLLLAFNSFPYHAKHVSIYKTTSSSSIVIENSVEKVARFRFYDFIFFFGFRLIF